MGKMSYVDLKKIKLVTVFILFIALIPRAFKMEFSEELPLKLVFIAAILIDTAMTFVLKAQHKKKLAEAKIAEKYEAITSRIAIEIVTLVLIVILVSNMFLKFDDSFININTVWFFLLVITLLRDGHTLLLCKKNKEEFVEVMKA